MSLCLVHLAPPLRYINTVGSLLGANGVGNCFQANIHIYSTVAHIWMDSNQTLPFVMEWAAQNRTAVNATYGYRVQYQRSKSGSHGCAAAEEPH